MRLNDIDDCHANKELAFVDEQNHTTNEHTTFNDNETNICPIENDNIFLVLPTRSWRKENIKNNGTNDRKDRNSLFALDNSYTETMFTNEENKKDKYVIAV